MTIEELKQQTTNWLICFVKANEFQILFGTIDLKLLKFANAEIKRRNKEAFARRNQQNA